MKNKVKKKMSAIEWNRRLAANEYTQRRITFGMHTGKMVRELPLAYIKWGVLNLDGIWAVTFARELQRRDPEFAKMGSVSRCVSLKDLGI